MDKLTAMRTFVTVARTGSFSAAAQVLSVPRTRVSQRIQELEAVLLVRLLHRTTRALSLTEEGRIYLPKCEHILEELDAAEQAIISDRTDAVGRLRLSCMSIVARSLIIPRLDEYLASHPRVSVSLSLTDRIVNLQEAGLDCAIRGGQMDDSSLISRHLADCGFGIYAAPALIAKGPPIHSPDQLRHLPLVKVLGQRDGLARNWSLSCNGQTMIEDSAARVEMDDDHGALECALGGAGLVLIPHFAAAPHLASKALVRVLPDWSAPDRPIYVIYPSRRYVPTKLRVFLDWVAGLM
jgi:LysR family transcriptional regulator, regulator for bpeEF and oprC